MFKMLRSLALGAVALLSLTACSGGATEDGSATSSAAERLEVVDKNASGTRITALVEAYVVPEVRRTGTLEFDAGTKCWNLVGQNPEGNWPVVWVSGAEPQSTDGRAAVTTPVFGLVSAGDDVTYSGLTLHVEDFANYPEECIAGAEDLLVVDGMRVDESR